MRRPRRRIWRIGGITLVVVAVGWLPAIALAHHRASQYAQDAMLAPPDKAVVDLRAAHILDPKNDYYRLNLAQAYLVNGEYAKAIATAKPISSSPSAVIQSKAYLEEGSGGAALAAVSNAASTEAKAQKSLCEDVNKGVPTDQRSGLAQELYAMGLFRSAERVLMLAPPSTAKYLLQAHSELQMQPQTASNVAAAQVAGEKGSALDPASIPAHELLRDIYGREGESTKASAQRQLIMQLEQGSV